MTATGAGRSFPRTRRTWPSEILLQAHADRQPVRIEERVADGVVPSFDLDGRGTARKQLDPSEQRSPKLRLRLPDVVAVESLLQEIDPQPRPDERMHRAAFPVVNEVDRDAQVPQRRALVVIEFRPRPAETDANAVARAEVILVEAL